MRVKLTTSRATVFSSQRPGDVVDVPDAEARELIRREQAVPVAPEPETAVRGPVENAARPHKGR